MAPTDTWTGNDPYWSDNDWSGNSPPASGDDVEIASGNPSIEPDQPGVTIKSLTIDPTGGLLVGADTLDVTDGVSNSAEFFIDDATVTVGGDFVNNNFLIIDQQGFFDFAVPPNGESFPAGGSTVTIDGTLTNAFNATVNIGNSDPTAAPTLVKANAVSNVGLLNLTGLTTLEIASAAGFGTAGEISGEQVQVVGNSVIQFDGDGQLTKIDSGAQLVLKSGGDINDENVIGSNSALAGLTDIEGGLTLVDETLKTSTGLTIHNTSEGPNVGTGVLNMDLSGTGGSTLDIGGEITNHYAIQAGNATLAQVTTITALGIDNVAGFGQLSLHGGSFAPFEGSNDVLVTPAYLTADLGSKAGLGTDGVLTGSVVMDGRALLEFDGGGSFNSVNGSLTLYGPNAFIADTSDNTTNSALTGLDENTGFIDFDDIALTTAGGFTNDASAGNVAQFNIDVNLTDVDGTAVRGGSNITFQGTFNNDGVNAIFNIGSANLTNATLVKATVLDNTGRLEVDGVSPTDPTKISANTLATFDIGSAAGFGTAGEITGSVTLTGDALIEFDGGGSLTRIDSGASLTMKGPYASIADTGGGANSALQDLSTNAGILQLLDVQLSLNGGLDNVAATSISSAGDIFIDNTNFLNSDGANISGGSDLTIDGAFTNEGNVTIGSAGLLTATTVSAHSFDNGSTGSISLTGNSIEVKGVPTPVTATLSVGGTSENDGSITLNSFGVLDIAAGSTFTEAAGSSMSGAGELDNQGTFILGNGTSVGVADIDNDGKIEVTTGSAEIGVAGGTISGSGDLAVGSGTTLEIAGGVGSGQTLQFTPDANIAKIDNLLDGSNNQLFDAAISGWGSADTVEISEGGLGSVGEITDAQILSSSSGTSSLGLFDAANPNDPFATLTLDGNYTGWTFNVSGPDGANYQEITAVACYCRGTSIRTEHGATSVEDLKVGDRVVTLSGSARPIKWIGTRSYGGRFILGRKDILPVCFKPGSLGTGLPQRDLFISPHHAMYLDGVLIEARHLVNGVSIVQAESVAQVDYFHIELDSHDVIVAEGAWSETFVDDDSRGMFHNAGEYAALYPGDIAQPARYCAPRPDMGFEVEAARLKLAEHAGLGAAACVESGSLRGFIDQVKEGSVRGWAQDRAHPEVPVCLDIYSDGRLIGRTLANVHRVDLRRAGLGSGRHAFVFTVPDGVTLSPTIEVRRSSDGAVLSKSARLKQVEAAAA